MPKKLDCCNSKSFLYKSFIGKLAFIDKNADWKDTKNIYDKKGRINDLLLKKGKTKFISVTSIKYIVAKVTTLEKKG